MRSSFGPGQKHGFDGNIYYKQWKEENPQEKKEIQVETKIGYST